MALHINNPETERNVRAMAAALGESIAEAMNRAALDRMRAMKKRKPAPERMEAIRALLTEIDALPRLNRGQTPDEIIGYDEYGLPS